MKELVEKVAALYADFSKDANAQIENGNKAAGTRARKASLEVHSKSLLSNFWSALQSDRPSFCVGNIFF